MRPSRVLALVSAASLLALSTASVSAQSPSASGGSPGSAVALEDTYWLLGEIANGDQVTAVPSGTGASLQLEDGFAAGSGGCNRLFASYTLSGDSLTFGPMGSTRMACAEDAMAFEDSYITALGSVASYGIEGTTLTLANAEGATVLTYGAAPPATVEGPWIVTGYNNGAEAVVSPIAGAEPSVAFHADGTLDGFGGCNQFGGGYSVDGSAIAIGPLHSTLMSCSEEIDTQEVQLLTALDAATTWTVSGNQLELRDDSGALQVSAVSAIG